MPGIIATLILIYILWRLIVGSSEEKSDREIHEELVQDPVCGLYLPESEAVKAKVDGQEICFCSEACRKTFIEAEKEKKGADPE
ncbi:YHS domain-containing protein [Desulfobotulus sp.]|jgi:YHS domain-containing protein|uniref:YHS domain-containing protein n=1 Tax=Desulfobotulus sp. TaxID=1940337 RepID=UPI002A363CEA|nr:YHS domain-containing protein [Desulfobotulus sp.]MDY0162548.1 YHS domain-containing protein [Desulfobotulus sp.]